jgi:hypothetical protein
MNAFREFVRIYVLLLTLVLLHSRLEVDISVIKREIDMCQKDEYLIYLIFLLLLAI